MRVRHWLVLLNFFLVLIMAGCGGGGSSSSSSAGSVDSLAADGYLVGATAFLDINNNSVLDADEPSALTTAGGKFTLSAADLTDDDFNKYPVRVLVDPALNPEVYDEDSCDENGANCTPIENSFNLVAPAGKPAFVSPLTTLVQQQYEAIMAAGATDPVQALKDAEASVKLALGIDGEDDVSLFDDYENVAEDHSKVAVYNKVKLVAQVVTKTMSQLQKSAKEMIVAAAGSDTAAGEQAVNSSLGAVTKDIVALVAAQLAFIVSKVDEYQAQVIAAANDEGAPPQFDATSVANSVIDQTSAEDLAAFKTTVATVTGELDFDGDGTSNAAEEVNDADGDGVEDVDDAFPFDATVSKDNDDDGIDDDADNCPAIKNANQVNFDGDAYGDVCDDDDDNDGVSDDVDAFPFDAARSIDSDGDGIDDNADNCPATKNYSQLDSDVDGSGDACDTFPFDKANDIDNDALGADVDNCPLVANSTQADIDSDGIGDACDAFPFDADNDIDKDGKGADVDNCPSISNVDQANFDNDGFGDLCDSDIDGDGVDNAADPDDFNQDSDADGLNDGSDAFPTDAAASVDTDGDGAPDSWNPSATPDDLASTTLKLDDFPNDATLQASAARPGYEAGRAALEAFNASALNADVVLAASHFQEAKTAVADSDNTAVADSARFLYALTRVAKVVFETQTDGDPSNLNNFSDFLDRLGVATDYDKRATYNSIALPEVCVQAEDDMGTPLFEMDDTTAIMDCKLEQLPSDAPTSGDMLGFVESSMGGSQGALADAISALNLISPEYMDIWTESSTDSGIAIEKNTEVDYSDVLFVRGVAKGLQAQINMLLAYDLDVNLAEVDAATRAGDVAVDSCIAECDAGDQECEDGCWELEYDPSSLLDSAPTLLEIQAADKLVLAKGQLDGGLVDIRAAIVAIQGEADEQADDFVTFYDEDCYWNGFGEVCEPVNMAQEIIETLADIDEALALVNADGPIEIVTDDMGTADEGDDETLVVDPSAFFGGLVDFRALLPFDEDGDFTLFPDTTLGGIFATDTDPLELNTDLDEDGVPDLIDGYSQFGDALLEGRFLEGFGFIPNSMSSLHFSMNLSPDNTFSLQWTYNEASGSVSGTWAVVDGQLVLTNTNDDLTFFATMTLILDNGEGGADWLDLNYNWSIYGGVYSVDGYGHMWEGLDSGTGDEPLTPAVSFTSEMLTGNTFAVFGATDTSIVTFGDSTIHIINETADSEETGTWLLEDDGSVTVTLAGMTADEALHWTLDSLISNGYRVSISSTVMPDSSVDLIATKAFDAGTLVGTFVLTEEGGTITFDAGGSGVFDGDQPNPSANLTWSVTDGVLSYIVGSETTSVYLLEGSTVDSLNIIQYFTLGGTITGVATDVLVRTVE